MSSLVQLFFKNSTGYGWSEKYYYNLGIFTNPTLNSILQGLSTARAAMLTNTCFITHIRVQSPTKKAPYIVSFTNLAVQGTELPPTAEEEVALLVRQTAVLPGVQYNRLFLRGIPQRIVAADAYIPDATFTNEFNNYVNELVGQGNWNIQGYLTATPLPLQPIANMTPTSPRGWTFTVVANTFAKGDVVRIRGCSVPGYNGLKNIVAVSPSGTICTVSGAAPAAPDVSIGATAQKQQRFDVLMGSAFIENVTRRAGGRPFGITRGRRQTTYSLRR